ncbi:hypothetical protein CAOG_06308 [Capsaspora owczarzaki ATCC 30864]|uniref:C2H2-type domain-containing protein n=1 Tax=Capsaspora owczarzaki (strain ATCC 30864) TaxID=595528 RepID=A0A0D2WTP3_CAPO3|nr:hypothetical protein CAOG_06308 [Capsaspora owczarzaki ATCC 30864]KJE95915.1 hypothetical protein CAOG_006308 [Capsaspora owczarzaki ATCC 30864]|eukprot:XP_004345057.2 hypothetical protein CAOG_06308 [Capsaspora owczarzaki ATCC 30864]
MMTGRPTPSTTASIRRCCLLLLIPATLLSLASLTAAKPCSHDGSRLARASLERLVGSRTDLFDWPPSCPLHPLRDVHFVSQHKRRMTSFSKHQCLVCGKGFDTAEHLDDHFDHRHRDLEIQSQPVCLADFCDVLGCYTQSIGQKPDCSNSSIHHLHFKCGSLFRSCLSSELSGSALTNQVNAYCQHLDCTPAALDQQGAGDFVLPKSAAPPKSPTLSRRRDLSRMQLIVGIATVVLIVAIAVVKFIERRRGRANPQWDSTGTFASAREQAKGLTTGTRARLGNSSSFASSSSRLGDAPAAKPSTAFSDTVGWLRQRQSQGQHQSQQSAVVSSSREPSDPGI